MTDYQRRTYVETDDYKIYLEEILGCVYIHVAIYNASVSAIKEIKEHWGDIVVNMFFEGYEELFCYTADNRIVNIIGGATKIAENVKFQNKLYEVWKWDLS